MTEDIQLHLLWLVERASGIRSATGWSRVERDRSWAHWDASAKDALAKAKAERVTVDDIEIIDDLVEGPPISEG